MNNLSTYILEKLKLNKNSKGEDHLITNDDKGKYIYAISIDTKWDNVDIRFYKLTFIEFKDNTITYTPDNGKNMTLKDLIINSKGYYQWNAKNYSSVFLNESDFREIQKEIDEEETELQVNDKTPKYNFLNLFDDSDTITINKIDKKKIFYINVNLMLDF
jgi:hypothetical protein